MEKDLPPFVGWTIVGHDWKFHIAWKDKSGNVTVLGPWRILNAGTGSHSEILILFALIKTVKQWLEKEYWTWICGNVLDGLGADSNIPSISTTSHKAYIKQQADTMDCCSPPTTTSSQPPPPPDCHSLPPGLNSKFISARPRQFHAVYNRSRPGSSWNKIFVLRQTVH
ncbi:hypothetical protein DL95DRAFT_178515 [Leptodontidium sp. 2 PMI_412]|nr:hypothetical protein DL95DRAFT_178515 [Leptodontidium sp. 2 PMI_412]